MKTKIKALILALCAVLLVVTTIFATVAYLTSNDTVTNTFTVGKVAITLDETDVDLTGVKDSENRVKANEYKLIPGRSYTKDPVIHVSADSEDCYLFVKVINGIAPIEADATVAAQMAQNGWRAVAGADNVYAFDNIAQKNDNIPVFESFTVKGDITGEALSGYADSTIAVTAYAVQHDGFDTAEDAWAAANFS